VVRVPVAVTTIFLDALVSPCGRLPLSPSFLGGAWVVAIGLLLVLAGVFATT
jgi:hypothetical protein